MARFLVLYRAPVSAREQMANVTPEQAQAGMDLWREWAGRAGDAIVDLGAPLADPAMVGNGEAYDDLAGYGTFRVSRPVISGFPQLRYAVARVPWREVTRLRIASSTTSGWESIAQWPLATS